MECELDVHFCLPSDPLQRYAPSQRQKLHESLDSCVMIVLVSLYCLSVCLSVIQVSVLLASASSSVLIKLSC